MNDYMSDKDQAQMIKDWWKKYRTAILLAITVFLATNFGVQYWNKYSTQKKEQASILYTQLVDSYAKNKPSEFKLFAQDLMKHHSSSSYASLAALILAKDSVENAKLDDALLNLKWISEHSNSQTLKQLAKSREIRILMAQNKPKQVLESLQKDIKGQPFAAALNETKGDALLAQNDEEAAIKAYADANNDSFANKATSPLLKMKTEQLGK